VLLAPAAQVDASSPAPDDEGLDPAPPELAFEDAAAPALPELALELSPPLEEGSYVAALTGAPVSPRQPSAPNAHTMPTAIARIEPQRFAKYTHRPYVGAPGRRGQAFADPATRRRPLGRVRGVERLAFLDARASNAGQFGARRRGPVRLRAARQRPRWHAGRFQTPHDAAVSAHPERSRPAAAAPRSRTPPPAHSRADSVGAHSSGIA
jgi:hypothetical protein